MKSGHPDKLLPAIVVDLHGLSLAFHTASLMLRRRFQTVYGHLPPGRPNAEKVEIEWQLTESEMAPLASPDLPVLSAEKLVSYYGYAEQVTIRMPKYSLLSIDLLFRRIRGMVTPNCLELYGAFEDVMMISLAPLYRRRGWFPVHAFAALAPGPARQVALIAGQMGSGKTTTGLALLSAGWKLLSNDSPLLTSRDGQVKVLAYPGQLSAFDDSLARFEPLQKFIPSRTGQNEKTPRKRIFQVEQVFTDPWASAGLAGAIFLPQVTPGLEQSALVPLDPKEALLALMPQAIEGWDRPMVGPNLQLLGQLVAQSPCYTLKLSPDVRQLPELISRGMNR